MRLALSIVFCLCVDFFMLIILETAVGSHKSVQVIDAPDKFKKTHITSKMATNFLNPPCISIACTYFASPAVALGLFNRVRNVIISIKLKKILCPNKSNSFCVAYF